MGFIAPAAPPVDIEEWKQLPHLERIKPLAQDWAVNGVGAPAAVYLLYILKLAVFVVGGALIYLDKAEHGGFAAYEDGFTLLELCRKYYCDAGLDARQLDLLVR